MGRKKTVAPAEQHGPEFVGKTPPAMAEPEARMNLAVRDAEGNAQALAEQLGYKGSLTVGSLEDEIRFYQRRTVEACLELGARLLLLKELTPQGDFVQRIELLGINRRMGQRFMAATMRFGKSDTKSLLAAAGNQSKLLELVVLDDDVGMPGGMIIGPATWREFFKPRLASIIGGARSVAPGERGLYHSDGDYAPIVGDLVEIGVDAINPLQPEYMDPIEIRRRHGARPALWGTVGRQTTFSWSTPAQIDREVKTRIDTLGRAGLVLSPAYDIDEPDVPPENVAAFLKAVRAYG